MNDLASINFDTLTHAQFEEVLPDLFASGGGKVSEDPRLQSFLKANPDCAELVRDLEIIAEHAKSLFEPVHEPSDDVWSNIASKLNTEPISGDVDLSE